MARPVKCAHCGDTGHYNSAYHVVVSDMDNADNPLFAKVMYDQWLCPQPECGEPNRLER